MAARIVLALTLAMLAVFHLSVTKEKILCIYINGCHFCKYHKATKDNCLVRRFCLSRKKMLIKVCIKHDHKEEKRSCGIPPPVNYIIGGSATNEGNWPWQVSLRSRSYNHMCGGVLIDNDWVLTAAHCVDAKSITDLFVVLGEFDLNRRSENEQLIWIKRIFMHPNFQPRVLTNDVALIQLEFDAHYNEYVSPICLPSSVDVYPPKSCSITGWGETRGTGDRSRLRVLNVTIWDPYECNNLTSMNVDPTLHICVNYGLTGACRGDSGGPLFCVRSSDGRFVVAGVTSWAHPTYQKNYYVSIYTNIRTYVPWINTIMNSTKETP